MMPDSMRIGHVSLNVSDIDESLDFYRSVLGFKTIGRSSGKRALLSANSKVLIELLQADAKQDAQRAGLYHFAILLPERRFLADMLAHLSKNLELVNFDGMADHLVSESIYIRDPDNIGIEIYSDRPRDTWIWKDGYVKMATERLDTKDLLAQAKDWTVMPEGTTIGHVHLHVKNLDRARQFYSDLLGLDLTCTFPGAHFFSAGKYHHHVAANTWLGPDIKPANPSAIGLNHFGIELSSKDLESLVQHLREKSILSKENILHDDDGIAIQVYGR